ncbi:hypothetical protein N6H05_16250 [Sphingobium sp. WTD-1]|uniref:hypothetical protein n=1 Tax=Sphingobium sp. WTD-1 TaxID=2979467 RepID=UPI0024DE06FA|nr:hypothetical protein [Sphingobium sp. WTD-1]WIA54606.1 hypothetical protein N6H05_16250 [Sphingobium sp. WTD-1]
MIGAMAARACAIAALLLSAASPALAAEPEVVRFQVGDKELHWTVPEGYCPPKGQMASLAQMMATMDTQNVTVLTLYACDATLTKLDRYILVKAPVAALMATLERDQFLKLMEAEFDTPAFKAFLDKGDVNGTIDKGMETLFGAKTQTSGKVVPMGMDDSCAIIGGSMTMQTQQAQVAIGVGGCLTAAAGKAILVAAYEGYDGPDTVRTLVQRSRDFALSIIAENEAPTN